MSPQERDRQRFISLKDSDNPAVFVREPEAPPPPRVPPPRAPPQGPPPAHAFPPIGGGMAAPGAPFNMPPLMPYMPPIDGMLGMGEGQTAQGMRWVSEIVC
jgi:hypothetical protein